MTLEMAADCVKACNGNGCQYHLFDHFIDYLGIDPSDDHRMTLFARLCGFGVIEDAYFLGREQN